MHYPLSSPRTAVLLGDADAESSAVSAPGVRAHTASMATAALVFLYLIQSLSPLRLDTDSVLYLYTARGIADGTWSGSSVVPVGYPAFVAVLDRLGLGNGFVLILANCAFSFIGAYSARHIFSAQANRRIVWIVPLTLLSVAFIRNATYPLPEAMFLACSMSALAVMTSATRARGMRKGRMLGIAFILTLISVLVRVPGIALVPAFAWACIANSGADGYSIVRTPRRLWTVAIGVIAIAAAGIILLGGSLARYATEAAIQYLDPNFLYEMRIHATGTLEALGDVVLNLPSTQFREFWKVFAIAGVVGVAGSILVFRVRRPTSPAGVFLAGFVFLHILWPYTALRLWMPVIPLLIGYLLTTPLRFPSGVVSRTVRRAYMAWFVLTGLGALAYTSRISFSGADFPTRYGLRGGFAVPNTKWPDVSRTHNERAKILMKRYRNPVELPF